MNAVKLICISPDELANCRSFYVCLLLLFVVVAFCFGFRFFVCLFVFRDRFLCVSLGPILEPALVDQAELELTEIHLPLPPKCWD